MPGFDQTGPRGTGAMTGRGLGYCGKGMGWRMGFGIGACKRGLGRYFAGNLNQSKDEQVGDLKNYAQALKEELADVEKELTDLQG